ncbi:MAG: response regulator [Verrucomicrobium sp.]|nr:response regulator [Verrucomicrobium sp.]
MLNQGTILLVEDDADAALLMKKAFASATVANPLEVVPNGQELMAKLGGKRALPADRPIMILLDLKLPGQSGFDLLEWIRKQADVSRLVVVVLTSSRESRDVAKAYALGANSYLVKPTSFHQLVELVKMLKSYWLTHNQFSGAQ